MLWWSLQWNCNRNPYHSPGSSYATVWNRQSLSQSHADLTISRGICGAGNMFHSRFPAPRSTCQSQIVDQRNYTDLKFLPAASVNKPLTLAGGGHCNAPSIRGQLDHGGMCNHGRKWVTRLLCPLTGKTTTRSSKKCGSID